MRIQTEPDFGLNWQVYLYGIITTDSMKYVKKILRQKGIEYPTIEDLKNLHEEDFKGLNRGGRNINYSSLKSYMMFKQMIT